MRCCRTFTLVYSTTPPFSLLKSFLILLTIQLNLRIHPNTLHPWPTLLFPRLKRKGNILVTLNAHIILIIQILQPDASAAQTQIRGALQLGINPIL